MAYASPKNLAYDDDEMLDRMLGPDIEPPEYPPGLMFSLSAESVEAIGAEDIAKGDMLRFSAMGCVTSVFDGKDDCRIELEIEQFAGPDGKFQDLEVPAHICLCSPELEKMELDADAERGDMIHLIGNACLESTADTEYSGKMYSFQIREMTFEDESAASRDGG